SSSASIWTNIKTFTLYPKNTQVLGRLDCPPESPDNQYHLFK
ncbi:type VI secretion system tube protein Hcp, partial [Salmonella enterica subsp. enterica serovar Newport]|nr:type VI secretion system tube protein Hcp [Salmonella enterica subsp. enterica serovar Newport]